MVNKKHAISIDLFSVCFLQKDSQGSSKLTTGQIRGIADLCLLVLPLNLKYPLQKRQSHRFSQPLLSLNDAVIFKPLSIMNALSLTNISFVDLVKDSEEHFSGGDCFDDILCT